MTAVREDGVATVGQCESALRRLADRLAEYRDGESQTSSKSASDAASGGAAGAASAPDRTISCRVRDLDVVFAGRLAGGRLIDIRQHPDDDEFEDAQIRFELTGDDLLQLVAGTLDVGPAWVSGRLKVRAGFGDLIRLRSFL